MAATADSGFHRDSGLSPWIVAHSIRRLRAWVPVVERKPE
jgi:hypothetical protein